MRKIKITAQLIPAEEGGYVVYCPELDITTEGETVQEAIEMLKDAASGYIEVVKYDKYLANVILRDKVPKNLEYHYPNHPTPHIDLAIRDF